MRSLVFSIVILFLIISFCVFATVYSLRGIKEMENILSVLERCSPKDARTALDALEKSFEKRHFLFSISLSMDDIDALKNALILLRGAVEREDDDAYGEALSSLRFALYRLRNAALPSPETVL